MSKLKKDEVFRRASSHAFAVLTAAVCFIACERDAPRLTPKAVAPNGLGGVKKSVEDKGGGEDTRPAAAAYITQELTPYLRFPKVSRWADEACLEKKRATDHWMRTDIPSLISWNLRLGFACLRHDPSAFDQKRGSMEWEIHADPDRCPSYEARVVEAPEGASVFASCLSYHLADVSSKRPEEGHYYFRVRMTYDMRWADPKRYVSQGISAIDVDLVEGPVPEARNDDGGTWVHPAPRGNLKGI